ncbi:MAG: hypothetical protein H0W07_03265 [Chloroflexi bacterium]|nr:hypothetical protein [Chloroflexota bacterium]
MYGTPEAFEADSVGYVAAGAAAVTMAVVPADRAEFLALLREGDVPLPLIDLERAALTRVLHPDMAGAQELFVVAPDGNGLWRLWRVG